MADQWRIRLTKRGAGFILRFVVPELSFLKWKQVYAQISPKEIWKAFMWGNERSAAYFWRIKGKLLRGKKEKWKWQVLSSNNTCTHTLARTHPFICPHWPTLMRASCNLLLWTQVHSNGHSHTNAHLRTHSPGLDVPDGGRRCCFSMNRLQFFAEGSGSTYTFARTCAQAHMHTGLMRAGVASGLTFLLPSPLWQLWSFLFMHSQTQRGRERGREMREAWIQLLLCIHSPTSSCIPLGGVSDAAFSCANSESNMSFCCRRIRSSKDHINQVICIPSFCLPVYFFFIFSLLLKDRRILDCGRGWGMESVFALSQLSDPKITIVSESPSKGTIQWSRLPQEIKAPSLLPCAVTPNSLHHRLLIFISSWHWEH